MTAAAEGAGTHIGEVIEKLRAETLIPLVDAPAEFLPARPSLGAVRDWVRLGIKSAGRRVYLEAYRLGREWWTSREACRRFILATQG